MLECPACGIRQYAPASYATFKREAMFFIEAKKKDPTLSDVADHIDHVRKVAGIDHVGIGTDFDGFGILPEGLESAADLPKIYEALMQRGYTSAQVRKILGENLLRVMDAVQSAAE